MKTNLPHSMPCAIFGHNYFKPNQLNFPNVIECRCCGHTTTEEQLIISESQATKNDDFQLLMRKLFSLQRKFKPHRFSLHHI
jgi:hypothetical protein